MSDVQTGRLTACEWKVFGEDQMNELFGKSKVFLEIVKNIREIISTDGLKTGDKIPSERELAERLNVGRSSVREALRALELLGLIETRRGEGTFLCDFKNHHLIKLLGMFILEDPHAMKDIRATITLLEKDLLKTISCMKDKTKLQALYDNLDQEENHLFKKILELSNNRLLYRIWDVLNSYSQEQFETKAGSDYLPLLINALIKEKEEDALNIYLKYKNMKKIN